MNRKVVVGMPGEVDSSMAARLLKEQGYDVIGVTIQIWQDEDIEVQEAEDGCCGLSAVDDARRVAMDLGIPHYVMNFKEEFRKNMMDYFVGEYVEGRTPNLCIACNRYAKWESLFRRSMAIGADYIAIGYYAQIDRLSGGRYSLKTLVTATKGQTYALCNLTREQLSHTLMLVESYHKEKTRDMAKCLGSSVTYKPDGQEICFIPNHDYASFIEEYTGRELPPGNSVDLDGRILGRHRGITHHTVGQRKGLNLSMGCLVSVVGIRPGANEAVIGNNEDVFTNVLRRDKLNWMAVGGFHGKPMNIMARVRYSHRGSPCTIREIGDDMAECCFHEPVRAVTPGQAVVSYDKNYVAGGGTIIR